MIAEIPAEVAIPATADLGEGAIWHAPIRTLYWIDINAMLVHAHQPASGTNHSFPVGQPVGTVVPRASGGLIIGLKQGIASLDLTDGKTKILARPEPDHPENRLNDGKCDPAGRFWVGSMAKGGKRGTAALYRFDADHSLHTMVTGLGISNGIVWSHDRKTMYFIDTPTSAVWAYDYEVDTGNISNRRDVVRVPTDQGHPDGMTIDSEGNLWVAYYGGGRVVCWNPQTGKPLSLVRVPASNTTSCAFGGDDLQTLYITTARQGLNPTELKKQPLAGSVFSARPGAKGVPAFEYAG